MLGGELCDLTTKVRDQGIIENDYGGGLRRSRSLELARELITIMANDPVLIAYTVKDRTAGQKAIWRRIGVAFPHDNGAGLTVLLDALPIDGRIVLVEPKLDPDEFTGLRDAPPVPPKLRP